MKNKYRQKILPLILILMVVISPSLVQADACSGVGQQTISNKGSYYHVNQRPDGKVDVYSDAGGWVRGHDPSKPLKLNIKHSIPLPEGATEGKLSFKNEDIKNFGKADDVLDNGHTNIKDGQGMIDTAGGASAPPTNYKDLGVDKGPNGKPVHRYEAEITLTPDQLKLSSIPDEIIKIAMDMKGQNPKTIFDTLVKAWDGTKPPISSNPNAPLNRLKGIAEDPEKYANGDITGMLQTLAIVEVTQTEACEEEQHEPGLRENSGTSSCSTEFEALMERREFLYTTYSTTDLPTPPTRNHGPCPTQDNAGFWNYSDDPAWGQDYFPVAGEGEHFKFWKQGTENDGYNKSIHYEKRPVLPGLVSTNLLGRPVKTTEWTPEKDAPYSVFLDESKGLIKHSWVDNRGLKDDVKQENGENVTRYCIEAYERLLIPKKQKWQHDWYQYYEWLYCWDERKEDSPADSHCISSSESCDESGKNCTTTCDESVDHGTGYHYKKGDHYNTSNTEEWDAGIEDDVKEHSIIPPVYEPWRIWKHRTEVEVEFHASLINTHNDILNFNKLDNPLMKSGYGVFHQGQATLVTDWDRTMLPSAYLIRPNNKTRLNLDGVNTSVGDAGSDKQFAKDLLNIDGENGLLKWSTKKGEWVSNKYTKGGVVVPKYGASRQHFVHLDYPDGPYNAESWVTVDFNGGNSPWRVRFADAPGIQVDGTMFSDQFVRPK